MGYLQDLLRRMRRSPLVFKPWPIFFCFLFGNTALAYTAWSIHLKLFIGLFFILLPALIACHLLSDEKPTTAPTPDLLPDPPTALYIALGALLLFTQFYRLEQNPFWPTMDDAREDYYCLHLSQAWNGRLLYGEGQAQPLYFWLVGFLCRLLPPSLLLFDAVPAALFTLLIPIAYWSARQFFPRGHAFLACAFLALAFPPYTISRFHQNLVLLLIFECLLIVFLARHLRAYPSNRIGWLPLALILGGGFYIYTSFTTLVLWAVLLVMWHAWRKREFSSFLGIGVVSLAIAAPILLDYMAKHGTDYYQSHFNYSEFGIPFFIALFWNGFGSAPYGPNWGGWYNSLHTSLIFLGVLRMYRDRGQGWVQASILGLCILFLPAVLTQDVEMMRIMALIPWLALLAALGVASLVSHFPLHRRWVFALSLLLVSAAMDFHHYQAHYLRTDRLPADKWSWRKAGFRDAFRLMEDQASKRGPGLVFHSFLNDYPDRSLEVYSFPFNALQNPRLDPAQAEWAAVVCDPNLLPFLKKRFPAGRWVLLGDDSGRCTFGIVPTDSFETSELRRWIDTHAAIVELDRVALYKTPAETWDILGPPLQKTNRLLGNDPFLKTIYADCAAMFFNIRKDLPSAANHLARGINEGYPSAKLLNDLGHLLFLSGDKQAARRCFEQACSSEINLTTAEYNLAVLKKDASSVGGR